MSILLKSALSEAVDALPDAIKPAQLRPALKKAGVKDEEIELSGIGVLQPRLINKEGKVSKRDLQAIDSMARLDEFSLKEYKGGEFADFPTKFGRILPRTIDKQESQYRERVYQFSHPEGVLSGSTHFPEADYLMHTRVYDDLIGNQDTRVVAEIQSDLHQHKKNIMLRPIAAEAAQKVADSVAWLNKPKEARLADYAEEFASRNVPADAQSDYIAIAGLEDRVHEIAHTLAINNKEDKRWLKDRLKAGAQADEIVAFAKLPTAARSFAEVLDSMPQYMLEHEEQFSEQARATMRKNLYNAARSSLGPIPETFADDAIAAKRSGLSGTAIVSEYVKDKVAPWETSWTRKGLENEIMTAIAEGKQQIAIPIKNAVVEGRKVGARLPEFDDAGRAQLATALDAVVNAGRMPYAERLVLSQNVERMFPGVEQEAVRLAIENAQDVGDASPISLMRSINDYYVRHNLDANGQALAEEVTYRFSNPQRAALLFDDVASNQSEESYEELVDLLDGNFDTGEFGNYVQESIEAMRTGNEFIQQVQGTQRASIDDMVRGNGVQKWYETYVSPLAQKLAKQTNSEFKVENKDGIEYAVIKFGPETKADFKLYSAGGGLAAYMAYEQGYSQDEVSSYMREQGFGEDEIAEANAQQAQIKAAKDAGYTDEEIKAFLETRQAKPVQEAENLVKADGTPRKADTGMPTPEKQQAVEAITSGNTLPADELLANLQVIRPDMSSVTTRIASFFGSQEAVNSAAATEEAAIANIKALGAERGLQFDFDGEEWTMMTESGPQVVTPGFLREIAAAKGETIGGIGGAIAGARAGSAAGGVSPLNKAIGTAAGALAGGVVGAAAGTQLDYIYSSMQLQEEMSAEIAAHKALTAAEAAAYGEVVGAGLYKAGGALWKGAVRAKDFILDGNSEGARKALRETMFLTDDEINEVVERFEQLVDTKGMTRAQKEITAVATTLPGAEDLVRAASSIDSTASRSVVRGIDSRAKQLQTEINSAGTDNTARVLKEDFTAYTNEVKKFYGDVKMQAASAPRAKYYKFNFDKTAVMPVLESLTDNIASPAVREKFLLRLNQARKYADGRTFADLLELRQVVNDFRFNNRIVNAKDFKAVDNVIQSIDARIESGARFVMPKPQEWLDNYSLARAKYSQMKGLEKNGLVKLLNRPGVTPNLVSSALLKHSVSIDGTYENVMAVLPKPMRELAEADMLNTLAKKYTAGDSGGMNAVQFPMFAEDLAARSFVSDHGRQMKEAITQLADTFKNDVMLSKHSGMMQVPQFQSYLTADPVVRAKYEIASTVFNKVKQSIPGSKASREIALIKLTADFLEKPLNAKTVGALKEAAKDTVGVDEAILSVQREQAEAIARGMDSSGTKIPVYGNGNILSSTGTGDAAMEIPAHRIASPAVVKSVADAEGLTVDSKAALDIALKRYGFKAVQYGSDKVRLLK